ncbi:MAG: heparinase II/III family protein [Hyphomicrobiales bacterium]|nr:heparinase II/III family protein [Hyphomicrobiales bacterium]MCP5370523.1 heparinase II/III family protein [Hyphomicrobiales bacterium]
MLSALRRKGRQVLADPVLRRWMALRLLRRVPGEPPFTPHRPPYLDPGDLAADPGPPDAAGFGEIATGPPQTPLVLPLAGETVTVAPGAEGALFARAFADVETALSLHRFAWLPVLADRVEPAWVQALWRAWRAAHGTPPAPGDPAPWPWHPYTAAERAINLLAHGRRAGLPAPLADTVHVLAAHGPAIAARLEYFGDHHTSNHLLNNGRGLHALGVELGLGAWADLGARILTREAARVFAPSGVLREGSSHYHLLLTRNLVEAWLLARRHGRAEEPDLATAARRALAVLPLLSLPGGMPLVGDISPDMAPDELAGLAAGSGGWTGRLDPDDRAAVDGLRRDAGTVDGAALAADGWHRFDHGPWSGLWHAAPAGWSTMPGHGHQDCGGFELHYRDMPLFRDLGRGAYGEAGAAAEYRAAGRHNTLMIDDLDPFPANRPYYDDAFRRAVGGPPPAVAQDGDSLTLTHHGYARLGGVGAVTRRWHATAGALTLEDRVAGRGRRTVTRLLHTTLQVARDGDGLVLSGPAGRLRLSADAAPVLSPATAWTAYGRGAPATAIAWRTPARLPWRGEIRVEVA